MAADLEYRPGDNWGQIFRKILQNIAGIASGSFTVNFSPGAGTAPTTPANAAIAVTGTAVQAIAAGSKGYIMNPLTANGDRSIYVGGATVTNGGTNRGIELSPGGISPLLTGPVFINGTSPDVAGVTLV